MSDTLQDLERRVTEKLIAANQAAHPEWANLPDPMEVWAKAPLEEMPPLPEGWPQYPREQWVTYPARRAHALILADNAIDHGYLAEAGWLVQYAGKERIA